MANHASREGGREGYKVGQSRSLAGPPVSAATLARPPTIDEGDAA